MRTWFNSVPPEHHALEASHGPLTQEQPRRQKARPGAGRCRFTARARRSDGLSRGDHRPPDGGALSL